MPSLSLTSPSVQNSALASVSDIARCFDDHGPLLTTLAFLVTGDKVSAQQCVERARENTLRSHSPFLDWIVEWAKTATIQIALLRSAQLIRGFERVHKHPNCNHSEHLFDPAEDELEFAMRRLLRIDTQEMVSSLDPLCRAVLVLRFALRSSFQECAFRLNVPRPAIIDANCRAMEWLSPHW